MNPVARTVEYTGRRPGRQVMTWCPGCGAMHPFTIEAPPGPEGEQLNSGVTWEWDGNLEKPTFSPSLLCYSSVHLCRGEHAVSICPVEDGGICDRRSHQIGLRLVDGTAVQHKVHQPVPAGAIKARIHVGPCPRDPAWGNCHSFLRGGVWEFLNDSAHQLAGQSVPMVPLPDGWAS